jgi:hypothetical protein
VATTPKATIARRTGPAKTVRDHCGPTVAVVNVVTGEIKEAQISVAAVGRFQLHLPSHLTQGLPTGSAHIRERSLS